MKRIQLLSLFICIAHLAAAQEVRDTVIVCEDYRYEGQWPEGKGVLIHETKGMFWGDFVEGMPLLCKHCDYFGGSYYGYFVDYEYEGNGIKFLKSGDVYEGQFTKGEMTGVAKYYDKVKDGYKIRQGMFKYGNFIEGREVVVTEEKFEAMKPVFVLDEITEEQSEYLQKAIKNTNMPGFGKKDMNAFSMWVNSRLVYPKYEKVNGIQGRVTISFVIEEDGKIRDIEVLRGSPSKALDDEAVRVVSSAPKFKPATINGHPVRTRWTFPIIFMLR